MPRKIKIEELIESNVKLHDNFYDLSKTDLNNRLKRNKIIIICPKHGQFLIAPFDFIHGRGCPVCGKEKKANTQSYTNDYFIKKANEVHNNFYNYEKCHYTRAHNKVIITCPIHGDFEQLPYVHLQGEGCPKCAKEKMKKKLSSNTIDFVEKMKQINTDDLLDFSQVNYKNNKTKVCVICHHKDTSGNEHGEFWMKPNNLLQGQGCPICNSSHLEKEVKTALDKNHIDYIFQYRENWIKPLILDFFIPSKNIAIECQGRQHYQSILYFGGIHGFAKLKERDKLKQNLCQENNVKLLYFTHYKNVNENETTFKNIDNLIKKIKAQG